MKKGDKITQAKRYIYIVDIYAGWVTYHIYYPNQVWVKKDTVEAFQKKYLKERHEQVLLF